MTPLIIRHESKDAGIADCVVKHNEYRLPDRIDGWVVYDIGAHIGSFTRMAIERGARRVLSFEACKDNFMLLQMNTRCLHCEIHLAAVHGNAPHEFPLEVKTCPWPNTGGGNVTPVEGSTVVQIHSKGFEEEDIDLLKLDCEGSEFDILTSMNLSRVKRIAMEFHEAQQPPPWRKAKIPHTAEALSAFLRNAGFKVICKKVANSALGKIFAER